MSLICSDHALRALHRVLICTRFQAREGGDGRTIAEVMDVTEYLVAILQNHEGMTEGEGLARFRLYLQDLEDRFDGFTGLTAAFDAGAPSSTEGLATAA